MPTSPPDDRDWVDRVTEIAGRLGLNPVRTRWKLERWRRSWYRRTRRLEGRVDQLRYRHQFCPRCGAIAPEGAADCPSCDAKLPSRAAQLARRAGLNFDAWVTAPRLLMALCVAAYVWVATQGEASGPLDLAAFDLIRWGGNYPPATVAGAWWRLASHMFLHAGLWHIGFNMVALHIVGNLAEEIYGWSRTLLVFLVTGLAAGVASLFFTGTNVSIGASGAIMGLIGLMAVWGHRAGTSIGKQIRGRMVRWVIYTAVFGVFIGADHAAHGGGLVGGIVLGMLLRPRRLHGPNPGPLWATLRWLLPVLAFAAAAAVPLTPTLEQTLGLRSPVGGGGSRRADLEEFGAVLDATCARRAAGDMEGALATYQSYLAARGYAVPQRQGLESLLARLCEEAGAPAPGAPVSPSSSPAPGVGGAAPDPSPGSPP